MSWRARCLRPALACVCLMLAGVSGKALAAVPGEGARRADSGPVRFDIPSGSLSDALDAYARASGVQILYPYALAARVRSAGLHARLTPAEALKRLLRGSGLVVARADAASVVLRAGASRSAPARPVRRAAPPPPSPPVPDLPPPPPMEIVVTGRASDEPLLPSQLSYSVTQLDGRTVAREGAVSTAELFGQIPGFWVEASGGEASNNVRARGIPTDGYSSVAILEDGLPVQYDGASAYLNTDQVFSTDATIARAEAVRGGPSSLFLANAPGGSVNFLTRNPLRDPGASLSATVADFGYGRIDGYAGGAIAPGLGLYAGGFYRLGSGQRDPGYPADRGGQFRLGLAYEANRLQAHFNVKRIDDRVILYLPVPLRFDASGEVAAIAGFDPLRETLAGPDTAHLSFRTSFGEQPFDLTDGTHSRIMLVSGDLRRELGTAGALTVRARLRTGVTKRSGLFPAGRPMTGQAYLETVDAALRAAYPTMSEAALRYADDGGAFTAASNGNGLVVAANALAVRIPMTEAIVDLRWTGAFDAFGRHDLAAGLMTDNMDMRFERQMGTLLLDVRGQARRLDVVARDPAGQVVGALTDGGFVRHGSLYDSASLHSASQALYVADEWSLDPVWRVDFGARWERIRIGGGVEQSAAIDLGDPATLADDAVLAGTGVIVPVHHRFEGLSVTLGMNVHPAPGVGLFARITRTARLPGATDYTQVPPTGAAGAVPITMGEMGLVLRRDHWNLSATAYDTRYSRLPFTDYRFDIGTNAYVEQISIANTATRGVELSGHADLPGPFEVEVQATLQDPRYRDFRYVELGPDGNAQDRDASGNQLIRVPRLAIRLSPSLALAGDRLRITFDLFRFSDRYADIANTQRLPGYTMLNAHLEASLSDHFAFDLRLANLTDTLGLTEGNPRVGSFNAGGNEGYFLARPEFGRSVRATLRWKI